MILKPHLPIGEHAKEFGAFYTDLSVAEFLVRWAVRSASDNVLDPSFGGGVFLEAAYGCIAKLGGKPKAQIFGVELDSKAHADLAKHATNLNPKHLICSDFFDIDPSRFPNIQAVVGNPPFIRYQRFGGSAREKALARASAQGVRLSRLSSSWAPFLVHSVAMLGRGGRLGMVIPAELLHAAYARPLLGYLAQNFSRVLLLTFRKKLFALSQDTLLLLAEGRGGHTDGFAWLDLEEARELEGLLSSMFNKSRQIEAHALAAGTVRFTEQTLSAQIRKLYGSLKANPQVQKLAELAEVGIGYVSGANDYFHLSPQQAKQRRIPERFLVPALRRSRGLAGIKFTRQDWQEASKAKDAGLLLYINGQTRLPKSVLDYIGQGEAAGVHQAYKCKARDPWYAVPQVVKADAFLTYMSGDVPRLVANSAGVVASNTLHVVRLGPGKVGAEELACLWHTSLTRLSAELEGHAMGGGMLKIEPREAAQILIATPHLSPKKIEGLATGLDGLLRAGQVKAAQALADRVILQEGLGLSGQDCHRLSQAADQLKHRRCSR